MISCKCCDKILSDKKGALIDGHSPSTSCALRGARGIPLATPTKDGDDMAIYHCSIKIISRSDGRSAVASAAYRAGEKLENQETGILYDFTRKSGVIYNEIILPENAPPEYKNRQNLWNAVQKIEKQSNAQLAREIEVALPIELKREQQIKIVHDYVQKNFVEIGMCADWAIHDKGDGNPHAHIMLTTRGIRKNGEWAAKEKKAYKLDEFGQRIPVIDPKTGQQKVRYRKDKGEEKLWERETVQANDWNNRSKAEEWREAWAQEVNQYLSEQEQVDHRSYARQGKEQIPTIHEGYVARKIERAGGVSELCEQNRKIRKQNDLFETARKKIAEELEMRLNKIKSEYKEIEKEINEIGKKFRIVIEYMPFRKQLESIPKIFFRKRKQFEAEHEGQLHALDYAIGQISNYTGENITPENLNLQIEAQKQRIFQLIHPVRGETPDTFKRKSEENKKEKQISATIPEGKMAAKDLLAAAKAVAREREAERQAADPHRRKHQKER